jgi:hypothetical protein
MHVMGTSSAGGKKISKYVAGHVTEKNFSCAKDEVFCKYMCEKR